MYIDVLTPSLSTKERPWPQLNGTKLELESELDVDESLSMPQGFVGKMCWGNWSHGPYGWYFMLCLLTYCDANQSTNNPMEDTLLLERSKVATYPRRSRGLQGRDFTEHEVHHL